MEESYKSASWCEHELRICPAGCVFEQTEVSLRSAHRHWHNALSDYDVPDDFVPSINAALQEMRNVTFRLQAVKNNVPGFDVWYEGVREELKQDPVMRWAVDARNRVVKKADLVARSTFRVTVSTGYQDEWYSNEMDQLAWSRILGNPTTAGEGEGVVLTPPVTARPDEILAELQRRGAPLRVQADSAVVFERRWVVEDYPKVELLDLLGHVYAALRRVVQMAHQDLLGMDLVWLPLDDEGRAIPRAVQPLADLPHKGRQQCMVMTDDLRTSRYKLSDGSRVSSASLLVKRDPAISPEELERRYGAFPSLRETRFVDGQSVIQIVDLLRIFGQVGESILMTGEDHYWGSLYFSGGRQVSVRYHASQDAQGKGEIARSIAREALRVRADLVLMMSETWGSPISYSVDGAVIPASLHPERYEALALWAQAKSGASGSLTVPFVTLAGEPPTRQVSVGDHRFDRVTTPFLEPLRKAWGIEEVFQPGDSFIKPSAG